MFGKWSDTEAETVDKELVSDIRAMEVKQVAAGSWGLTPAALPRRPCGVRGEQLFEGVEVG